MATWRQHNLKKKKKKKKTRLHAMAFDKGHRVPFAFQLKEKAAEAQPK